MTLVIFGLIFAISLGPRIPLGIAIPNRTFDLRVEDIIVLGLGLVWLARLAFRPRMNLTPLIAPMGAYVSVVVITTLISLMVQPASLSRPIFYIGKDLEYFFIFLLIANLMKTESSIQRVCAAIIAAGLVNVGWVAFQLIRGQTGPLLSFEVPEGVYSNAYRYAHYGTTLIGEASPLSTGAFFALASYLAFAFYLSMRRRNARTAWLLLGIGLAFSAASMLAGIKLSIVFLVIGALVLIALWGTGVKIAVLGGSVALGVMLLSAAFAIEEGAVGRVFNARGYVSGFAADTNRFDAWATLLPYGLDNPLVGAGRGRLWLGPKQDFGFEEAHNHYLKVFIESGINGLIAFGWLLFAVGSMAIAAFRNATSATARVVSSTTLSALVALGVASVAQDAFKPVLPNEIFWILVGLTAAVYRIERASSTLKLALPRTAIQEVGLRSAQT